MANSTIGQPLTMCPDCENPAITKLKGRDSGYVCGKCSSQFNSAGGRIPSPLPNGAPCPHCGSRLRQRLPMDAVSEFRCVGCGRDL